MATSVYYRAATREVLLVPAGRTAPTTHTSKGSYTDIADDSFVPYHYVRDLLYADDVEDMGFVNINAFIPVTSISTTPTAATIAALGTQALTTVVTPSTASNTAVTYASSDATKATVHATTGLVTGVATGSATITATSTDGGLTDTVAITVS
jgi:uncharacterized protein YjdB